MVEHGLMKPQPSSIAPLIPSSDAWGRWVLQTARRWGDVEHLIRKTGVEAIDHDHRQMTEIALDVNNLIDLVSVQGIQLDAIQEQGKAINSMFEFAKQHFDREIDVIRRYKLPGLDVQLEQHASFLEMMRGFVDDFSCGRLTATLSLKNSVLDWWVNHINNVDYHSFCAESWSNSAIHAACVWEDVEAIIKTTGVALLDQEHRRMAETALELAWLYGELAGRPEPPDHLDVATMARVDAIFVRLIDQARRHFIDEESFIRTFDLPMIEVQQHLHHGFMEMLHDFRRQAAAGGLEALLGAQQAILHWWITHINDVDHATLSLDKWSHVILTAATSWDEAKDFIGKTGEPAVDEDHKQITIFLLQIDVLIQEAEDSVSSDEFRAKSAKFFSDLYVLVERHFAHEEAIMFSQSYLLLDMHKGQHKKYLTFLVRTQHDIASGRVLLSRSLKQKILKWWVGHIREFDLRAFNQSRFVEA